MKSKRKIIPILLVLVLFCCSCGMENIAGEAVKSEQIVEELTVEDSTIENSATEESEEMPAIVFFLNVELYWYKRDEDTNKPLFLISFFDNQGNLYSSRDSYFNEMTYKEIYDEFAGGKLNDYLTLVTTCELDELRENYELLKSVAENEELRLVPDRYIAPDGHPDVEGDANYWWSAFYYNEDGNLTWIEFRTQSNYPYGITYRADDERTDQIYEWLVSVSETWK
ncbi:MAG: hypothetical protein K2H41_15745 [Acetatifactor sp.]|nr:hypothetical protein [Acetatifactor sp.]